MGVILDRFREKFPQYAHNDDLTLAPIIAEKLPQYPSVMDEVVIPEPQISEPTDFYAQVVQPDIRQRNFAPSMTEPVQEGYLPPELNTQGGFEPQIQDPNIVPTQEGADLQGELRAMGGATGDFSKPGLAQTAIGTLGYEGVGAIKGLTMGYVDPTSQLEKIDYFKDIPEESKMAGEIAGQFMGMVAPIKLIQGVVGLGTKFLTSAKYARPFVAKLAESLITGGTYGVARNPGEDGSRLANARDDAGLFLLFNVGFEAAGKGLSAVAKATGMRKIDLFNSLKRDLTDKFEMSGKSPQESAQIADGLMRKALANKGGWEKISRKTLRKARRSVNKLRSGPVSEPTLNPIPVVPEAQRMIPETTTKIDTETPAVVSKTPAEKLADLRTLEGTLDKSRPSDIAKLDQATGEYIRSITEEASKPKEKATKPGSEEFKIEAEKKLDNIKKETLRQNEEIVEYETKLKESKAKPSLEVPKEDVGKSVARKEEQLKESGLTEQQAKKEAITRVGKEQKKPIAPKTEQPKQAEFISEDGVQSFGKGKEGERDLFSQPVKKEAPTIQPLSEEAKKFKSAEEFVASKDIVFHGTPETFDKFDIDKRGTTTNAKSAEKGVFFTSSQKTADSYRVTEEALNKKGEDIWKKIKELEQDNKKKEADSLWRTLDDDQIKLNPTYWEMKKSGETKEVMLDIINPLIIDMEGKSWNEEIFNQYILQAKNESRDGVILKNTFDANANIIDKSDVTIVFNEKDIKTKQQLTDIWNEANMVTKPISEPKPETKVDYKAKLKEAKTRAEVHDIAILLEKETGMTNKEFKDIEQLVHDKFNKINKASLAKVEKTKTKLKAKVKKKKEYPKATTEEAGLIDGLLGEMDTYKNGARNVTIEIEEGQRKITGSAATHSTYAGWWHEVVQGKLTKNEVEFALEKYREGKRLGARQELVVKGLISEYRKRYEEDIREYEERYGKYREPRNIDNYDDVNDFFDDVAKTAQSSDEYIEDFSMPGGLSTKKTTAKKVNDDVVMPESVDPEVEKSINAAKGIKEQKEDIKGGMIKIKNAFTRKFIELDTKNPLDAKVNDILRNYENISALSKATATEVLKGVTGGLGKKKFDIFSRNIILEDLKRDIDNNLYDNKELPFGYKSVEQVEADYKTFNDIVKLNPEIQNAIKIRNDFMNSLRKALVDYGIMPEELLKNKDYFHHQILDRIGNKVGVSAKDVKIRKKGFQRRRAGSMSDYNTNYLESEFEVISQAVSQIEVAKTIKRLRTLTDVSPRLAEVAKNQNMIAIHGGIKNWNRLKELKGIKAEMVAAKEKGSDLAEISEEISELDILAPFNRKIAIGMSKLKKLAEDLPFDLEELNDKDLFTQLSKLAKMEELFPEASIAARTILKGISTRKSFIKRELGENYVEWDDMLPEGYVTWKPKEGLTFYQANTITDKVLEQVLSKERQLSEDDVQKVVAIGKSIEWAIPENIATTLDSLREIVNETYPAELSAQILNTWKQWVLLNPFRVWKYQLNNLSGDVDIALAVNPKIITYAYKASKDLAPYHRGKGASKEILEGIKYGAIDSGLTIKEIPDISKIGFFKILTGDKPNLIEKYWTNVKAFTAWRENILRFAAFRHFKHEIAQGKNPYGASKSWEVDAISDPTERAAKLAREAIGDYGNLSQAGEWIRKRLIPFWSFQEINSPRYYRLLANLAKENRKISKSVIGFKAARKVTKWGWRAGKLAIFANIVNAMIYTWNNTFFGDQEDALSKEYKRKGHLILGVREDGSAIYMTLNGALKESLEWFGKEDWIGDIQDIIGGEKTIGEDLMDTVKAPVKKLIAGARPEPKLIGEMLFGQSLYPDPFNPRAVRDRVEHASKTFSLDIIYRYLAGKPTRGIGKDLTNIIAYDVDPGESAYWIIKQKTIDYQKEHGSERPTILPTEKSNNLYYYKQALKFGDTEAAEKYYKKYREGGGTSKSRRQSISKSKPLGAIARKDYGKFKATLTADERKILHEARLWYSKTYRRTS